MSGDVKVASKSTIGSVVAFQVGDFAMSALAAATSHCIHHPLYTLKSQMMFYGSEFSFKNFLKRSLREPTGFLYRGLIPRAIGIMPEKAFKMQAYVIVGAIMDKYLDKPTYTKWLVAGAAAGAATTIIGCPSERAMVLAQIQKQGFIHVVRKVGLIGLYDGWTATLYRDITFNMAFFTTREMFVAKYEKWAKCDANKKERFALGLVAGTISAAIACPLDVIKTRMQGKQLGVPYESCLQIFNRIVRKEGARNLMKGLSPRLYSVPSMMSAFYVIYEEYHKIFVKAMGWEQE